MTRSRFDLLVVLLFVAMFVAGCSGKSVEDQRAALIQTHTFFGAKAAMGKLYAQGIQDMWSQGIRGGLPTSKIAEIFANGSGDAELALQEVHAESRQYLRDCKPSAKELKEAYSVLEEIAIATENLYVMASNPEGSYRDYSNDLRETLGRLRELEARWKIEMGL